MAGNRILNSAAKIKHDEFYTLYYDIQRESKCYLDYNENIFQDKTVLFPCDDPEWSSFTKFFTANFGRYKMKKLISTSYAADSKKLNFSPMIFLFESESPQFDESKTNSHGKIFVLEHENYNREIFYLDNLKWDYLEGDGDFRNKEVKKLFAETDIIITNPPFSLFREFLKQIMDFDKKFLIIGNINCITYKEVFHLIKENKIWLSNGMGRWISGFFYLTVLIRFYKISSR